MIDSRRTFSLFRVISPSRSSKLWPSESAGSKETRAVTQPTSSLDAYDLLLRGRSLAKLATRQASRDARQLYLRAIGLDSRYALAHALLGWTYYQEVPFGWTEVPSESLADAEDAARDALAIDPDEPSAHRLLGAIFLQRRQYELAIAELDRAIGINPSDAASQIARGLVLVWSGRAAEAATELEAARRYDPDLERRDFGWSGHSTLGLAYYLLGRYGDAVAILEQGLSREADVASRIYMNAALAAAYAELGHGEEAARAREELLKLQPFFSAAGFAEEFRSAADRERLLRGLGKAGVP